MKWNDFVKLINPNALPHNGLTAKSHAAAEAFTEAEIRCVTQKVAAMTAEALRTGVQPNVNNLRHGVRDRFLSHMADNGVPVTIPDEAALGEVFSGVVAGHIAISMEDPEGDAAHGFSAAVMNHCISILASLICITSKCDLDRASDISGAASTSLDAQIRRKLAHHHGATIRSNAEGQMTREHAESIAAELSAKMGTRVVVLTQEEFDAEKASGILEGIDIRVLRSDADATPEGIKAAIEGVLTGDELPPGITEVDENGDCGNPECPVHGNVAAIDELMRASLVSSIAIRVARHGAGFAFARGAGTLHEMGRILAATLGRAICSIGGPSTKGQDEAIDEFTREMYAARTEFWTSMKSRDPAAVEKANAEPATSNKNLH